MLGSTYKIAITRFRFEVGVALGVLAFGILTVIGATQSEIGWQGGPRPGYMPLAVGLIIIGSALGILAGTVLRRRQLADIVFTGEQMGYVATLLIPLICFIVGVTTLGMYVSIVLYMAILLRWQGHYRYDLSFACGLLVAASCFAVFELWFKLPLPKGPLEAMLGIY